MLTSSAYFKSESAAYKILDDFAIDELPVPVTDIAQQLNLQLVEYSLGPETSGVLVIENGIGTIGVNPKDSIVRRRFTIAHELGHYTLHKDSSHLFVDNYFLMKFRKNNAYTPTEYKHEQEANSFAAALLMPEKFIEKELMSGNYANLSESDLIAKLATKFEVSVPAMSYRLGNLNIF